MESLSYLEDKQKLKSSSMKHFIIGLVMMIAGVGFLVFTISNFSAFGYLESGFLGALTGGFLFGGFPVITVGVKRLGMQSKPERTILIANRNGLTFAKDIFSEAECLIPWADIQSLAAKNQSTLCINLNNPDAYINSLNGNEKKQAILNKRKNGTPLVMDLTTCAVSAETVASEVGGILKLKQCYKGQ